MRWAFTVSFEKYRVLHRIFLLFTCKCNLKLFNVDENSHNLFVKNCSISLMTPLLFYCKSGYGFYNVLILTSHDKF